MKWKLLNVRHSDDRAMLVLISVALVAVSIIIICGDWSEDGKKDSKPASAYDQSKSRAGEKQTKGQRTYTQEDIGYGDGSVATSDHLADKLFDFDPNTADSTTLLKLGLSSWQVRLIYRYRAHGGRYREPADFAQLYGLTLDEYNRLLPHIKIKDMKMAADNVKRTSWRNNARPTDNAGRQAGGSVMKEKVGQAGEDANANKYEKAKYKRQYKIALGEYVNVNTADTTELKTIPGIGSYYARQIVWLRNRKKIIANKEELLAINGFPEDALKYVSTQVEYARIKINTASQKELQQHPLINYAQAQEIMKLRRSAGRISSISDLSFLRCFTAEHLEILDKYIDFE